MRKSIDFETGANAFLNGRSNGKLRIGIPKRDRVSAFRIDSDLSRANRAHAMAMDGRRYEDIAIEDDARPVTSEWGAKRVCWNCANSVYDMGRNPVTCPKCGTRFDREAPPDSCHGTPVPESKPILKWR